MPKRPSRAQHPSSPGLVGAASVDEKRSTTFSSNGGAATEPCEAMALRLHAELNGAQNGNSTKVNDQRVRGHTREELGVSSATAAIWSKRQVAEVGRILSGAVETEQKRGPRFRAPYSGYNLSQYPG